MQQDWKDILASMGGSTTQDSPETTPTEEPKEPSAPQTLHVLIDKKGRKGKVATIIEGFTLPDEEVAEIASELKRRIGTGGSSRGGEILLQGDWLAKAKQLLAAKGFRVK